MSLLANNHIAIVANDSGAAELILAWFKSGMLSFDTCSFCLEGPAAKLFQLQQPNLKFLSLEDALIGARVLLSGTGWSSSLEHNARVVAKKNGIKTIAVIDHWVNYRERFVRNHIEVLPDIIWVSDEYAYLEAKRCFPNVEIVKQKNDYLKSQIDEILTYKIVREEGVTNVLYVLEPIRDSWAGSEIAGEFQGLDFFIISIPNLDLLGELTIILKPHPSDPLDKYDRWVSSIGMSNIYVEKKKSLANLLAWSDVVVGCETYAMVVALATNKRVISSLPSYAHNCRLPHDNIERLNQIGKVKY